MNILIISNESWGDVWFSKHHYAYELSTLGHRIYFVDPPGLWSPSHLWQWGVTEERITENLSVLRYKNPLPLRVFAKWIAHFNDFCNTRKLLRVVGKSALLWQFDVNRLISWPSSANLQRVYHVVDPYMMHAHDCSLAAMANLVVCTSPAYLPHYQQLGKQPLHIPHGISSEEFSVDISQVAVLQAQYGDYVLLTGTINEDVDLSLLQHIADKGYRLLLVGAPVAAVAQQPQWMQLTAHPRVENIGIVHAKQLKHYIRAARVCITAYQFGLQKVYGSRSPLKILNYLAQHRPVLVTTNSEIPALDGKSIWRAISEDAFISKLQELWESPQLTEETIVATDHYLEQHRYPLLIERILLALQPQQKEVLA